MAQNKEQLSKLLLFIKRLIDEPGNENFVSGLRKLLNVPVSNSSGHELPKNKQLNDIEKYLGLDYQLDSTNPDIDYSFITDNSTRNQLISDYREMLRYRYGVRSHKIDFSEFCRYAMLQVEQMLNYYYKTCFNSNEEIMNYINERVKNVKIEKVESLMSLSLAYKMSAFLSDREDSKIKGILDYTREVRNEQSHRFQNESDNYINKYRAKLVNIGLPLTKEGDVYWNGIKENYELREKYNSLNKKELWIYRYHLWHRKEPFAEVLNTLSETAKRIKESLS